MEREEFKCSKCGACCRAIRFVEEASFLLNDKGECKYFDSKNNLCTIYDFRPNICRVDKMYDKYRKTMTWEEYLKLNYDSCDELREMEKKGLFGEGKKEEEEEEYLFIE